MQQDLFASAAAEGARLSIGPVPPACAGQAASATASEARALLRSDSTATMETGAVSSGLGSTAPTEPDDPCASSPVQDGDANRGASDDRASDAAPQDVEAYVRRLSETAPRAHRHALAALLTIQDKVGLSLRDMPLTAAFLAEQIEIFGLHGRPSAFAKQVLTHLDRLAANHPLLRCLPYERVTVDRIRMMPESEWPTQFRSELLAWKQSVPLKMPGAMNPAHALTARTIKGYEAAAISALSALRLSGVRFSDEIGVLFCLRPAAVAIWVRFLSERRRPATVQATLAGVLRIARDMQAEASCIQFLEARLAAIMGSLEIDTARLAELAEPANFLALIDLPEVLMRQAEDSTRLMSSRLAAARSAVAFQLMWEYPDLSEKDVAEFDLGLQIGGSGSELTLLRSGGQAPERLSPTAARLVERLLNVYGCLSVSSQFLLPGRDDRPRAAANAMQLVYHQIQGVLHRRVIRSDLRDLNIYLALSADDADLAAIAAGAGYKHTKSLALRFGHSADRPKRESNQ